MKKLLFLSAIVIAMIMSACSSEDYKSYVPADSKVVLKLDIASFLKQAGVDQEKLMKDLKDVMGDDVDDLKDTGFDITSPMYVFARRNGMNIEGGLVVKVDDRSKCELTYTKNAKSGLIKKSDYSLATGDGQVVAIADDACVLLFSTNTDKGALEKTLDRVMGKTIEGDNKILEKADGKSSFASLSADLSIIPDIDIPAQAASAGISSQDLEKLRSMEIDIDGSISDGVCDFMCGVSSSDSEVQSTIDKTMKAYGFISEKAFSSFSSNDVFGFVANADGAQIAEYLKESITKITSRNPDMAQMIGGMVDKVTSILSKFKGNIVGVMRTPNDFTFLAEGKNVTPDVVGLMQETGVEGLQQSGNGYCMDGSLWFGYSGNNFYVTMNPESAAQPSKAMGDPAPAALTNLMKNRKFVIFTNLKKAVDMSSQMGVSTSSTIKPLTSIFDKIDYVTYSMK